MESIIAIPALNDNYIWLFLDKKNKHAFLIDPGDADPVIAALEKLEVDLKTILLTHHHLDHSGGIQNLIKRWSTISVIGSQKSLCQYLTHRVKEGDSITCGSTLLQVMEIPGHTLDHLAYYNSTTLFCGDTLFSAGCGKVFEGTYPQMYHSLNKLYLLPDTTKIYCGHEYTLANLQFAKLIEPQNAAIIEKITSVKKIHEENSPTLPSFLSTEKQINPFLRCIVPAVIQAAENHAGKRLDNPVEVFTCLREWKNDLVF